MKKRLVYSNRACGQIIRHDLSVKQFGSCLFCDHIWFKEYFRQADLTRKEEAKLYDLSKSLLQMEMKKKPKGRKGC